MRCPATKFITHTLSHITFLILLAAATFRLDNEEHNIKNLDDLKSAHEKMDMFYPDKVETLLKATLRPANILITNVQICLMFWVAGNNNNIIL